MDIIESDNEHEFTMEDQLEMEAVGHIMDESSTEVKPRSKLYKNNREAITQKYEDMQLENVAGFKLPWIETLDISSALPMEFLDVHDDLGRERVFYQQALEAAKEAKRRVLLAGVPFERPDDFFAEMVKTDEHMERIRQRLVEEAKSMKMSEEAKKMRDMKKFGKKVQTQKLLERQKAKSDMLEKINAIKKKRKNNPSEGLDEEFDITLDEDFSKKNPNSTSGKKMSRGKRDEKFGFGGKKKYKKSNTVDSTDDFKFSSAKNKRIPKGMKGSKKMNKPQRPGKSKRQKVSSN